MSASTRDASEKKRSAALQHISDAHKILTKVRQELGRPGLEEAMREAIQKIEVAMAILEVKTGGML